MDVINDNKKWKEIFQGEKDYQFKSVGLSMLINRLSRKAKKEPASINQCIDEAVQFCKKYRSILEDDIATIFNV